MPVKKDDPGRRAGTSAGAPSSSVPSNAAQVNSDDSNHLSATSQGSSGQDGKEEEPLTKLENLRLCIVCRKSFQRANLFRLTVDYRNGAVILNEKKTQRVSGRSAYLCRLSSCLEAALKGTRLKQALQGRKVKGAPEKRTVLWPLESQLIHTLRLKCTENSESCQNTLRKEGC